jgi:hypothetical protein
MRNVYCYVHCGYSLDLHVSAYPMTTQNPAACPYLVLLKIPAVIPCPLLLVHVHFPFPSLLSPPSKSNKTCHSLVYKNQNKREKY